MKCVSLCFSLCILVLVLGQLEPVKESDYETDYVLQVISGLDKLMLFKNFITLLGNLELGEGSAVTASVQQRLMETFGRPVITLGSHTMDSLDKLINNQNLVLVLFEGLNDQKLSVLQDTLTKLKSISIIFVYKPNDGLPGNLELIEAFFQWCGSIDLYYILLLCKNNNLYETWTLEGKVNIDISNGENMELHLMKRYLNRKFGEDKYEPLVALYESLPDAFMYESGLGGQTGLMITEFMRYAKGTMNVLELLPDDYYRRTTSQVAGERNVDIGANLVSNHSLAPYSPLVLTTKRCLVVPYELWASYQEYITSVNRNGGLAKFALFYIIVNAVIKRLVNPRVPLDRVVLRSVGLTAGQSISSRAFRHLGLPEKFMEISIQLYVLMVTSIVCSALTMALTTGLRKSDIVDVDSFLASNLRIMVNGFEVDLFKTNQLPRALSDRLIIVDQLTRDRNLLLLNESNAYVIETHKWLLLEFIQKRLRQPKLKLGPDSLCTSHRYLRLPIRQEMYFKHVLKSFVGRARETGLADKWMRMGLRQAELTGMIRQAPYEAPFFHPLPVEFFKDALIMYVSCISLSLVAMLIECIYVYWNVILGKLLYFYNTLRTLRI